MIAVIGQDNGPRGTGADARLRSSVAIHELVTNSLEASPEGLSPATSSLRDTETPLHPLSRVFRQCAFSGSYGGVSTFTHVIQKPIL